MPRKHVHKTDSDKTPTDILQRAVKLFIADRQSLRLVAKQFRMCHASLSRYVKERKEIPEEENFKVGYAKHKQVFTNKQEELIEEYLKSAASIYLDLHQLMFKSFHMIMIHSLSFQCQNHGLKDEVLAQIGLRAL